MAQSKYLIYPLYNSIVIFQFANCKRLPEGISQKTRVFEWQERVLRQTPAGWPSILKTSSFLCPFVGNPWFWATRRWPETIGHLESFYQWGLNFEWPNVQGERKSISWVAAWIPMWWFLGLHVATLPGYGKVVLAHLEGCNENSFFDFDAPLPVKQSKSINW